MPNLLNALAFTLCLFAGVGLFVRQMSGRIGLLRAAKGTFTLDDVIPRLRDLLTVAIGQKKFLRRDAAEIGERTAGWMHAFIFWGFMILGLQVVQMFARAYLPNFDVFAIPGVHLLQGPYVLAKDGFQLIVLVSVLVALTRWLVTHPKRLFGFVPADDGNKNNAIRWLSRLTPSAVIKVGSSAPGQTNTFEALNAAFGLVQGQDPEKASIKTEADTMFLLSDGMPTTGRIVEPQMLLDYVATVNKRLKMTIHCIAFGSANRQLMEMLAQMNGGQYVRIGS